MNYKLLLIGLFIYLIGGENHQNITVTLARNGSIRSSVNTIDDRVADKALKIASLVFNSPEFQDSIIKLRFPYQNHCRNCAKGSRSPEKILGQVILDSLLRDQSPKLILNMLPYGKKPRGNKCFGLGKTCPDTYEITSYHDNIDCLMGHELPFACAYAIHLCHEYTHNVGYCHTTNDVETDVAEAVGEIAYDLVKKWYNTKDSRLLNLL